jgi:hypothetical protein
MIWLVFIVSDWPIIMINPNGLLLKVPHLFIVPILVLWVGCDLDLCQQVHSCDTTFIRQSPKLMDGLLHRMWLGKNAKGGDSWYHEHYKSHFLLFDVFLFFLCFCCLQVMSFGFVFFMECSCPNEELAIVKKLFVPLFSILWGDYTWKYICYRWRKDSSVFLDDKSHL